MPKVHNIVASLFRRMSMDQRRSCLRLPMCRVSFFTFALAMAGCKTPALQYPAVQVASHRLAAFPSYVKEWEYDADGKKTLDDQGAATARMNLDESIGYRVWQHGGRFVGVASIAGLEQVGDFHQWALDAMTEIGAERLGYATKKHETVGDWGFGRSLGSWRAALDADFVLVSMFLDGHNTPGRGLKVLFVGGRLAARRGIICAVQLQSGRIVWCNFDSAVNVNFMSRSEAQSEVDHLLDEMLRKGEAVPSEPPPTDNAQPVAPDTHSPPPQPSVPTSFSAPSRPGDSTVAFVMAN